MATRSVKSVVVRDGGVGKMSLLITRVFTRVFSCRLCTDSFWLSWYTSRSGLQWNIQNSSRSVNPDPLSSGLRTIPRRGAASSTTLQAWRVVELAAREMYAPTANLVSGQLVACYGDSCEINNGGEWMHLAATSSRKTTTEFSSLEDMTQEAQSGSRWTALLFRWIKAEIVCGVYQDAGPPCSCRRYKISYDNSKWIQNIKHNIGNLDNLWYIFANKELFETFFRFKMFVHLLHSFL